MGKNVRCVWRANALLGEGPVWNADEQALYWVDGLRPAIHRYFPLDGRQESFPVGEEIGCIAFGRKGEIIVGLRSGVAFLDLATGIVEVLATPETDRPGNRLNDGKCDSAGRFWVGSMDAGEEEPSGALYRIDGDRTITRMLDGMVIPNGIGWSLDGRTMYVTNSTEQVVMAYDFDGGSGGIDEGREFARIPRQHGMPDGLTVDAEDFVWSAHWGGGRVTRYDPGGKIDGVLSLPVANVTSCAFGGKDLDRLYVTTATFGLSEKELGALPMAGGLFEADVGVAGVPDARYAGSRNSSAAG